MPFYLDWTFWTVVVSILALILSQLPPVHILIKPKRLEVEVHSRVQITHQVGNPNVALVVRIGNTGGRELRIKHLQLDIARDGKSVANLPAQGYFETAASETSVLFVPFTLKPNEHWTHSVSFVNLFDRQTEKIVRERSSLLQVDIQEKLQQRPEGNKEPVIAQPENVEPFLNLFRTLFIWGPGEYIATLLVVSEPGRTSCSKKYRFTIYESDTKDLIRHTEDYKYGGGINYTVDRHAGVWIPLTEHIE